MSAAYMLFVTRPSRGVGDIFLRFVTIIVRSSRYKLSLFCTCGCRAATGWMRAHTQTHTSGAERGAASALLGQQPYVVALGTSLVDKKVTS